MVENGEILIVDSGQKSLIQLNKDKSVKTLIDKDSFVWPIGLCKGLEENEVLISDATNNKIISYNLVTTETKVFAGVGTQGNLDGNLSECLFYGPRGMFKNGKQIIVCDSNNNTIRFIEDNKITSKEVLKNAKFNLPTGMTLDQNGDLIICDCENHCIQKLTKSGELSIICGKVGHSGYVDGDTSQSLLNWPYAIVCLQGNLIFSEAGNNCLRMLKNGVLSTLVYGGRVSQTTKRFDNPNCRIFGEDFNLGMPRGLCLYDNELIVTESMNSRVSRIVPIDWETSMWVLTIQKNNNEMTHELLPEIIHYIATLAYVTWRF